MKHKLIQIIKLILTVISLYLCYFQYSHGHPEYVIYWLLVSLYWFLNYLTGLNR